jgi:hypothetical protein
MTLLQESALSNRPRRCCQLSKGLVHGVNYGNDCRHCCRETPTKQKK